MPQEIIFPAAQTFTLQDYADDAPLQPDEIRGRTLCTLISQGTELGWAAGDSFPVRPGYAAVFEVEQLGSAVAGVRPGELRLCMGAHRSTQTHLASDTLPLPAGLAPETAVLARLMGVSMTTLMTTRARAGDRVVVCGAGPVGLLAAQLFQIGGYRVSVVEPDARRREQAASAGLDDCHARMPLTDPAYAGRVALVIDCSGHEAAVLDGCQLVRTRGEVVLVGVPWKKRADIDAHQLLHAVFFKLVTLRSGWEWELPLHGRNFVWEELRDGYNNAPHSCFGGFERALAWLAEGRIRLPGLVRSVSPVTPAQLYGDIAAGRIAEPFIVLDWR